jgi:hypothetical protein
VGAGAAAPSGGAAPAPTPAPSAAAEPKAADKPAAAAPSAPAQATATDAPISTKISQDEVLAMVNKNGELFNACYTLGAGKKKGYTAKVTLKATVSPLGTVNAVEIIASTAKSPKVDACVADAFKKLVFTRPKGSGATVLTFPLSFDGIEQAP